jgi:pimeloyl-ACP methyl ester carboxylesterase
MREGRVRANGIEFGYLEEGAGPLLLLLHGFPDTARTWSHQIGPLAAAGFRVVAPWLRGYPPTEIPRGGFYDRGTLATDLRGLVEVLGGGEAVFLVGQDWGAIIAYQALAAFPELFRRAAVLAVPHPAESRRSMLLAKHVQRSFHWWFFQLPDLPEAALAANDFAFVDYLWDYWTVPGFRDDAHIAEVKRLLATPGALGATLGYYRAMLDPAKADPALEAVRQAAERPIAVPTLALCGADDLRAELMVDQGRHFTGEYRFELVPGAGHFLHRERPDAVTRLLRDWLLR